MKQDKDIAAQDMRVLVVDDEPDVLDLLKVALSSLRSWDVTLAPSARVALEMLSAPHTPFDAFLLDIQMPTMSGIELLAALRAMPGYAATPVLMLTAMSDRDYLDAAFREGAHDYITKPFDYDDLLYRLDAVCEPHRIEARPAAGAAGTGPARVIGRFEFSNYVAQLSANRLLGSQIVAVRLLRADEGPAPSLAELVAAATADEACLLCEYGKDTCLVLAHDDWTLDDGLSEARLHDVLRTRAGATAHRIVAGAPVSLRAVDSGGVLGVMQAAVAAAEARARAVAPPPAPAAPAPVRAAAQDAPARGGSLFETVMRELYGAKSYLGARR